MGGQFAPNTHPEAGDVDLIEPGVVEEAMLTSKRVASKYQFLWRSTDADDIVGETLLRFVQVARRNPNTVRSPGAYCTKVARTVAIRQVTGVDRSEVRQAVAKWRSRCAEEVQRLGRQLVPAEEDAIAEEVRASQQPRRRAPENFHYTAHEVLYGVVRGTSDMHDIDDPPPASADDFAPGSTGAIAEAIAEHDQRDARLLAWKAIAERSGAPCPGEGILSERRAAATRKEVRGAGGVGGVIAQMQYGDHSHAAALFAPFGKVEHDGQRAIVQMLRQNELYAEDLWDSAVGAATSKRTSALRS